MKAQEVFRSIMTDLVRSIQAAALYPETHRRVQEPLARLHRPRASHHGATQHVRDIGQGDRREVASWSIPADLGRSCG